MDNTEFIDTSDERWHVRVDVNAIQRVRDMVGLDLAEILVEGSDLVQKLDGDPVLLVRTIYAVMEPTVKSGMSLLRCSLNAFVAMCFRRRRLHFSMRYAVFSQKPVEARC